MARKDGFGKLHESDAGYLAQMLAQFKTNTLTGKRRVHMTLYCFSCLYDKSEVPYFKLGQRTIAKHCDVTDRVAQVFVEQMESDGWFVRIEKTPDGKTPKRTFVWMADGLGATSEGQNGFTPETEKCCTLQRKQALEVAPLQHQAPVFVAHQSTEYRVADETPPTADACAGFPAEEPPKIDYEPVRIDPRELGPLVFPEVP